MVGPALSAPLYPTGSELLVALVDAADGLLAPDIATTCRRLAATRTEAVTEFVRRELGPRFPDILRQLLTGRRDGNTGSSWTPTQEAVCRLPVAGVVTTGFDSGLLDARMRVRPRATSTGFATWSDAESLDRWRTGNVFGDDELTIPYAHGVASRPTELVLGASDFRRAYAGRLGAVLADLFTRAHLIWVGFGPSDAAMASIEREVGHATGALLPAGPRHVVLQLWDGTEDPATLRRLAELEHAADLRAGVPLNMERAWRERGDAVAGCLVVPGSGRPLRPSRRRVVST